MKAKRGYRNNCKNKKNNYNQNNDQDSPYIRKEPQFNKIQPNLKDGKFKGAQVNDGAHDNCKTGVETRNDRQPFRQGNGDNVNDQSVLMSKAEFLLNDKAEDAKNTLRGIQE